jgi:glycosyltransferase involved in cell wall biosynthesis
MNMKVGILGSRGIPNNYGGFEQFAGYLSTGLVERGADVWVYNSHNHPFKEPQWHGVNLIRCYDPEVTVGMPGQFVYDLNCIIDSRKRDFDILLQLGYTSSSVWHKLLPRESKIVTNMDGIEWKRCKYSKSVQCFLKFAEKLAVKSSNLLIADSEVIQDYLLQTYQVPSTFISYGADILEKPDPQVLANFGVTPRQYYLLIARMQPDNHIGEIIRGIIRSGNSLPLLIIGDTRNSYGSFLKKEYTSRQIRFLGSVFDKDMLDQLRYFSKLYFHGHSSGGTNPSLLEAMAASAPICAHDNPFNRSVLGSDAFYFENDSRISEIINNEPDKKIIDAFIANNEGKIRTKYVWSHVITAYYEEFIKLIRK